VDSETAVKLMKPIHMKKADGTFAHSQDKEFLHAILGFLEEGTDDSLMELLIKNLSVERWDRFFTVCSDQFH
jgi:hypothetical protein